MKKLIPLLLSFLLMCSFSLGVYALSASYNQSNGNYTLNGTSNLDINATDFSASSFSFVTNTQDVDWIYLHSYVYVNGILLKDESNSSTNDDLIYWYSTIWNRPDWFTSFRNMTYHSSVDSTLGNISFVTENIY